MKHRGLLILGIALIAAALASEVAAEVITPMAAFNTNPNQHQRHFMRPGGFGGFGGFHGPGRPGGAGGPTQPNPPAPGQ